MAATAGNLDISSTTTNRVIYTASRWAEVTIKLDSSAGGTVHRVGFSNSTDIFQLEPGDIVTIRVAPQTKIYVFTNASSPVRFSFIATTMDWVEAAIQTEKWLQRIATALECR